MSFVLTCPHCGVREVTDFAFGGEVCQRPTATPSPRELNEYNYFRRNVAGVQREWWYHRSGCRTGSKPSATPAPTRCCAWGCRASCESRALPQPAERIDRATSVSFTFDGSRVSALEGDTIGSALYAAGQRTFSRSFKYHRRRGLMCCAGPLPQLPGRGRRRARRTRVHRARPGRRRVEHINATPSLEHD